MTSSTPDTVIANNSHTIGAVIVPAGEGVDLRLTKTDSIDPVALNAPFTYTLTVTNAGATEATSVVVTDNMPSGIAISYATSPSGMCSAIGSQVLCSFASILPGQTVTMTFNATGTSVGAWTNQASVTSAQIELTPADNVVSETTMVIAAVSCSASFVPPIAAAGAGLRLRRHVRRPERRRTRGPRHDHAAGRCRGGVPRHCGGRIRAGRDVSGGRSARSKACSPT